MITKQKLIQWNQSAGGLYYPEELSLIQKFTQELADKISFKGLLSIFQFPADDDGSPIREKAECLVAGENLIVNTGRASIASLQRTTAASLTTIGVYDLGYLAVGDGSGGGAGHTPLPTDTALQNERTDPVGGPVVSGVPRPALSVTAPPPGPPFTTNLWTGQLATTELNGVLVDEAGLICLDDTTLFSYRTFAAQTKSASYVMELRWSIIF